MLAIMGWPLCMILYKVVTLDRTIIILGAVTLCMLGVWTINSSTFDVFVMLACGVIGYFMMRYGYSVAAAAITAVLGKGFEAYFRRGLMLTDNNVWQFVSRPWTAVILILCISILIYGTIGTIRLARKASVIKKQAMDEHLATK